MYAWPLARCVLQVCRHMAYANYLQYHAAYQRVDGRREQLLRFAEAPEDDAALREYGEQVQHVEGRFSCCFELVYGVGFRLPNRGRCV